MYEVIRLIARLGALNPARSRRKGRITGAHARVVVLDHGDVDRLVVERVGAEMRLLVFASEEEPLIQARLTPRHARALAMALRDVHESMRGGES